MQHKQVNNRTYGNINKKQCHKHRQGKKYTITGRTPRAKRKRKKGNKKIRNKMRKFKVLYMNIRGLKSKLGSLCEVVKEEQPEILGIVETMLDDKDDIQIDGYTILRKDRNGD